MRNQPRTLHAIAFLTLAAATTAAADVVVLHPAQDNTLYEDGTGGTSNGAGQYFFAGQAGSIRRGLVQFDVAGAVPAGSTIQSVQLTLHCSRSPFMAPPVTMSLHRVLTAWGEGDSDAGEPGGSGTAAEPGDATWIHTFSPGSLWTTAGGDFDPSPSASASVAGPADYTWASTSRLVEDVQGWLDTPSSSRGWIVIGQEGSAGTNARRFDSRENAVAVRPRLQITYNTIVGVQPSAWTGVKALYR